MAAKAPTLPTLTSGGGGGGTDERVKISITDAAAGYLNPKITAHTNTPLSFNILNPGLFETLEFDLDGDQLHIDWVPTNYTRNASPAEAADVNDLTAHLKGIDDFIGINDVTPRLGLEKLFNVAFADHYTELTYTGDNLTQIDIWEDASKTTKLFTRVLSYTGSNLTTVTTTDNQDGSVLTTTLVYSGDNLINTTKVVT